MFYYMRFINNKAEKPLGNYDDCSANYIPNPPPRSMGRVYLPVFYTVHFITTDVYNLLYYYNTIKEKSGRFKYTLTNEFISVRFTSNAQCIYGYASSGTPYTLNCVLIRARRRLNTHPNDVRGVVP